MNDNTSLPKAATHQWPSNPINHDPRFSHIRWIEGDGSGGDGAGTGGSGSSATGGQGNGGSGEGTGTQAGANDDNSGDADDGDEKLGEGGKKALQSERETNRQLKADLAQRDTELQKLKDAGKSDEDKRNERFEQLEQSDREKDTTISQQASTILRYQVAAAKGLDLEAAERLRGATKEDIEADADTWIKKWGGSKSAKEVPGAGQRGDSHVEASPGIGRMRNAYGASNQ